jgi:Protein of unknown function (DUF4242)
MGRFLVERVWDEMDEEELARLAVVSKRVIEESFPDITWERTHVVSSDGPVRSFCIYEAPNMDRVYEHSAVLGCHRIDNIYEIAGDIDPADFPS